MFVAGRRRELGIGLLAAGMVLLSACSGSGSTPQTLPRLSTTPAAATSAAPPTSQAAELAAASEAVRQFFRVKNSLARKMAASDLARLVTTSCSCQQLVKSVSALAREHRRYFGQARLTGVTPAADSSTLVEVLVSYDSTPGGTMDASGHVLYKGPARHGVTQMFYVRSVSGRWLIDQIRLIDAGSTSS